VRLSRFIDLGPEPADTETILPPCGRQGKSLSCTRHVDRRIRAEIAAIMPPKRLTSGCAGPAVAAKDAPVRMRQSLKMRCSRRKRCACRDGKLLSF